MSEPIKISTGSYKKEGAVEVDGNLWTAKMPGAATQLRYNQSQRRLQFLDKKLQDGTITSEELDQYDEHERSLYDIFLGIFRDGTEDNHAVKEWLDNTPLEILVLAMEDLKDQANGTQETSTKKSS